MRESSSQNYHRIKETNRNAEDDNIDNGNISTDRTDIGSPSGELNILNIFVIFCATQINKISFTLNV